MESEALILSGQKPLLGISPSGLWSEDMELTPSNSVDCGETGRIVLQESLRLQPSCDKFQEPVRKVRSRDSQVLTEFMQVRQHTEQRSSTFGSRY